MNRRHSGRWRSGVLPAVAVSSSDDHGCSHLLAFDTFLGNTDNSKENKEMWCRITKYNYLLVGRNILFLFE